MGLAATALAASGTVLFGATALADGVHHVAGGSGGSGGTAQPWCLVPIAAGLGILGSGSASGNSQCDASAAGGSGGPGVSY